MGFTVTAVVTDGPVSSYLTFSPLPSRVTPSLGGIFSVALSLESLPLGVTQHPAPRCSDFPRNGKAARDRLARSDPWAVYEATCIRRNRGAGVAPSAGWFFPVGRLLEARQGRPIATWTPLYLQTRNLAASYGLNGAALCHSTIPR